LTVSDSKALAVLGKGREADHRAAVTRLLTTLFGPHADRDENACAAIAAHLRHIPEAVRRAVAPLSRQWLALYVASGDHEGRLCGIFRDQRFRGVLKAMLEIVDAQDLQEENLTMQFRQGIEHLPALPHELTDIGAYRRQEVCRLARKIDTPDSITRALAIPVLLGLQQAKLELLRRARRITKTVFDIIAELPESLADMRLAKAAAAEPAPMRGDLLDRLANLLPAAQVDLVVRCRCAGSESRIRSEMRMACFGAQGSNPQPDRSRPRRSASRCDGRSAF
jgi:hypothetical protein